MNTNTNLFPTSNEEIQTILIQSGADNIGTAIRARLAEAISSRTPLSVASARQFVSTFLANRDAVFDLLVEVVAFEKRAREVAAQLIGSRCDAAE
jgi:hypothetical protein